MAEDKSDNIGCLDTIFIVLLILKLFGLISLSWGWIVLIFILAIL